MLRRPILAAADSAPVRSFVDRYGMRLGAQRFVAGETLDQAVAVLRRLNEQGLRTNTTLLGENVRDRDEAEQVTATYEEVLRRIDAEQLETNLSVKPTQLGAVIDRELAYANIERLVAEAGRLENFVRIDMEDTPFTDLTLEIYRRLREAGHDNVGTVLQAYLYRTADDLESLLPLAPNLRIVKGAYKEPPHLAYPKKADVDASYDRLVARSIDGGRVHRGRDARRGAHRPRPFARRGPGPDGAADALRRTAAAPARPRPPGQPRPRCHAVRARLVPVPDAAAGRAPGEPALLREERDQRVRKRNR